MTSGNRFQTFWGCFLCFVLGLAVMGGFTSFVNSIKQQPATPPKPELMVDIISNFEDKFGLYVYHDRTNNVWCYSRGSHTLTCVKN